MKRLLLAESFTNNDCMAVCFLHNCGFLKNRTDLIWWMVCVCEWLCSFEGAKHCKITKHALSRWVKAVFSLWGRNTPVWCIHHRISSFILLYSRLQPSFLNSV